MISWPNSFPRPGKWSGGRSGVGIVYRDSMNWLLRKTPSPGAADLTFQYGGGNSLPLSGNWKGQKVGGVAVDGIGVFYLETRSWLLRNTASPGEREIEFTYGGPSSIPVVGDWDGNGKDGIGVYYIDSAEWSLRYTASAGEPEIGPFNYGSGAPRPPAQPAAPSKVAYCGRIFIRTAPGGSQVRAFPLQAVDEDDAKRQIDAKAEELYEEFQEIGGGISIDRTTVQKGNCA